MWIILTTVEVTRSRLRHVDFILLLILFVIRWTQGYKDNVIVVVVSVTDLLNVIVVVGSVGALFQWMGLIAQRPTPNMEDQVLGFCLVTPRTPACLG